MRRHQTGVSASVAWARAHRPQRVQSRSQSPSRGASPRAAAPSSKAVLWGATIDIPSALTPQGTAANSKPHHPAPAGAASPSTYFVPLRPLHVHKGVAEALSSLLSCIEALEKAARQPSAAAAAVAVPNVPSLPEAATRILDKITRTGTQQHDPIDHRLATAEERLAASCEQLRFLTEGPLPDAKEEEAALTAGCETDALSTAADPPATMAATLAAVCVPRSVLAAAHAHAGHALHTALAYGPQGRAIGLAAAASIASAASLSQVLYRDTRHTTHTIHEGLSAAYARLQALVLAPTAALGDKSREGDRADAKWLLVQCAALLRLSHALSAAAPPPVPIRLEGLERAVRRGRLPHGAVLSLRHRLGQYRARLLPVTRALRRVEQEVMAEIGRAVVVAHATASDSSAAADEAGPSAAAWAFRAGVQATALVTLLLHLALDAALLSQPMRADAARVRALLLQDRAWVDDKAAGHTDGRPGDEVAHTNGGCGGLATHSPLSAAIASNVEAVRAGTTTTELAAAAVSAAVAKHTSVYGASVADRVALVTNAALSTAATLHAAAQEAAASGGARDGVASRYRLLMPSVSAINMLAVVDGARMSGSSGRLRRAVVDLHRQAKGHDQDASGLVFDHLELSWLPKATHGAYTRAMDVLEGFRTSADDHRRLRQLIAHLGTHARRVFGSLRRRRDTTGGNATDRLGVIDPKLVHRLCAGLLATHKDITAAATTLLGPDPSPEGTSFLASLEPSDALELALIVGASAHVQRSATTVAVVMSSHSRIMQHVAPLLAEALRPAAATVGGSEEDDQAAATAPVVALPTLDECVLLLEAFSYTNTPAASDAVVYTLAITAAWLQAQGSRTSRAALSAHVCPSPPPAPASGIALHMLHTRGAHAASPVLLLQCLQVVTHSDWLDFAVGGDWGIVHAVVSATTARISSRHRSLLRTARRLRARLAVLERRAAKASVAPALQRSLLVTLLRGRQQLRRTYGAVDALLRQGLHLYIVLLRLGDPRRFAASGLSHTHADGGEHWHVGLWVETAHAVSECLVRELRLAHHQPSGELDTDAHRPPKGAHRPEAHDAAFIPAGPVGRLTVIEVRTTLLEASKCLFLQQLRVRAHAAGPRARTLEEALADTLLHNRKAMKNTTTAGIILTLAAAVSPPPPTAAASEDHALLVPQPTLGLHGPLPTKDDLLAAATGRHVEAVALTDTTVESAPLSTIASAPAPLVAPPPPSMGAVLAPFRTLRRVHHLLVTHARRQVALPPRGLLAALALADPRTARGLSQACAGALRLAEGRGNGAAVSALDLAARQLPVALNIRDQERLIGDLLAIAPTSAARPATLARVLANVMERFDVRVLSPVAMSDLCHVFGDEGVRTLSVERAAALLDGLSALKGRIRAYRAAYDANRQRGNTHLAPPSDVDAYEFPLVEEQLARRLTAAVHRAASQPQTASMEGGAMEELRTTQVPAVLAALQRAHALTPKVFSGLCRTVIVRTCAIAESEQPTDARAQRLCLSLHAARRDDDVLLEVMRRGAGPALPPDEHRRDIRLFADFFHGNHATSAAADGSLTAVLETFRALAAEYSRVSSGSSSQTHAERLREAARARSRYRGGMFDTFLWPAVCGSIEAGAGRWSLREATAALEALSLLDLADVGPAAAALHRVQQLYLAHARANNKPEQSAALLQAWVFGLRPPAVVLVLGTLPQCANESVFLQDAMPRLVQRLSALAATAAAPDGQEARSAAAVPPVINLLYPVDVLFLMPALISFMRHHAAIFPTTAPPAPPTPAAGPQVAVVPAAVSAASLRQLHLLYEGCREALQVMFGLTPISPVTTDVPAALTSEGSSAPLPVLPPKYYARLLATTLRCDLRDDVVIDVCLKMVVRTGAVLERLQPREFRDVLHAALVFRGNVADCAHLAEAKDEEAAGGGGPKAARRAIFAPLLAHLWNHHRLLATGDKAMLLRWMAAQFGSVDTDLLLQLGMDAAADVRRVVGSMASTAMAPSGLAAADTTEERFEEEADDAVSAALRRPLSSSAGAEPMLDRLRRSVPPPSAASVALNPAEAAAALDALLGSPDGDDATDVDANKPPGAIDAEGSAPYVSSAARDRGRQPLPHDDPEPWELLMFGASADTDAASAPPSDKAAAPDDEFWDAVMMLDDE